MTAEALIVIYESLDEEKKLNFGSEQVAAIDKQAGSVPTFHLDSFSETYLFDYLRQALSVVSDILVVILNSQSSNLKGLTPIMTHALNSSKIKILCNKTHPMLNKLNTSNDTQSSPKVMVNESEAELRMNIQSWIENLSESS